MGKRAEHEVEAAKASLRGLEVGLRLVEQPLQIGELTEAEARARLGEAALKMPKDEAAALWPHTRETPAAIAHYLPARDRPLVDALNRDITAQREQVERLEAREPLGRWDYVLRPLAGSLAILLGLVAAAALLLCAAAVLLTLPGPYGTDTSLGQVALFLAGLGLGFCAARLLDYATRTTKSR